MNDRLRQLAERWKLVNQSLEALADGLVDPGGEADPFVREQQLLGELDEIEFEVAAIQRAESTRENNGEIR
ncbi:MAG: hypothetical protein KDA29_14575 [Phycisphaerales bacterium]|nr:hypothetical protein [Phycisphaerales bacterium]